MSMTKEEWWGERDPPIALGDDTGTMCPCSRGTKEGHLQCAGKATRCCCGVYNQRRIEAKAASGMVEARAREAGLIGSEERILELQRWNWTFPKGSFKGANGSSHALPGLEKAKGVVFLCKNECPVSVTFSIEAKVKDRFAPIHTISAQPSELVEFKLQYGGQLRVSATVNSDFPKGVGGEITVVVMPTTYNPATTLTDPRGVLKKPESPSPELPRCSCACGCNKKMRPEQEHQRECDPCALGMHVEAKPSAPAKATASWESCTHQGIGLPGCHICDPNWREHREDETCTCVLGAKVGRPTLYTITVPSFCPVHGEGWREVHP